MDTKHTVYVNPKKPCFYSVMEQQGFPKLGTLAYLPGYTSGETITNWLVDNWMIQIDVMQLINEVFKVCEKQEKMAWAVRSASAQSAVEAFFVFVKKNYDTLKHLGAAFNMPNPEDVKPFVSPELLAMSFSERQELLRKNQEARLEIVPEEEL